MKLLFIALTFLAASAQALCPANRTAYVRAEAYSRATDSLTYCGTNMKIIEVLSRDECSLTEAELLGQMAYLNNGQLQNGHDCETSLNPGDALILKIVQIDSKLKILPEPQFND